MIRIVERILERHVLVHTVVCTQEVFGLGAQNFVSALHASCAPVPRPRLTPQEGVGTHVLQASGRYCQGDILHMHGPLCIGQVRIEVSGHQQIRSSGLPSEGYDNIFYG